MENIGILDAGVIALLGYAVVFFGLILLMIVITIMGKFFTAKAKKPVKAEAAAPAAAPAPAAEVIENKQEMLAAISAVVAEELGRDVSQIKILSFKKM